jgi:hypothetical protein
MDLYLHSFIVWCLIEQSGDFNFCVDLFCFCVRDSFKLKPYARHKLIFLINVYVMFESGIMISINSRVRGKVMNIRTI